MILGTDIWAKEIKENDKKMCTITFNVEGTTHVIHNYKSQIPQRLRNFPSSIQM